MITIRRLNFSEISLLQNFPPEEWSLDLPKLISFHFEQPYFYPAIAELNSRIVGCGIAMIHGHISWLGTIIVLPEFRRQGIGLEITRHLVEYCFRVGCTSQLLIATDLGEPVYQKLGFEPNGTYEFFDHESTLQWSVSPQMRELKIDDYGVILELDTNITGENRQNFLKRFLPTGWVYTSKPSGKITGFYLPDLGSGLIMASECEAGLNLMKLRLSTGKTSAVIPSSNVFAKDFLLSEGFRVSQMAKRMFLGKEILWQPKNVYARASGYCG
jgi:GNAT superfamily N-acetyltransferase